MGVFWQILAKTVEYQHRGINKRPLQERLKKAIRDGLPIYTANKFQRLEERSKKKKAPNTTAGLKSFPQTAYWRELVANKDIE
jgi:hypothetical protein